MKKLIFSMLLMMSAMANAAYIAIDEGATIQTGSISYDGAGGALVGTGIIFTTATGGGATPLNNGSTLNCVNCVLNFITGLNTLEGPAIWQWLAGGSFDVTGDLFDGITPIASGTLLSGIFDAPPAPTSVGGGSSMLFVATGGVTAAQGLVDYFGITNDFFTFANTELALGSCNIDGVTSGFSCGLQNADLAIQAAAVPVPGTLLLMGLGLLGFGIRKLK